MITLPELLSLVQDKAAFAQEKIATSYDNKLTNALQSLGLQRKLQEEPKSDTALLAALFSAGLVTGLTLSLLFAPKAGNEVRQCVRRAIPLGGNNDQDECDLPRYDLDNEAFREMRRQNRCQHKKF